MRVASRPSNPVPGWFDGVPSVLLLCIPAFLNRSALLFADSRSYYIGGRMVLDRALTIISHLFSHAASDPAAAVVTHAKAVRSIYYSVLSYLLVSNGTLWLIIAVQSALSVWVIATAIKTFQPADGPRTRLLTVVTLLTLFSTLPWVVSMFMPDIFTPLMVLSLACLALGWADLSDATRAALLVMFAASLLMHLTNLPIACGLIVITMAMQWRSFRTSWRRWSVISLAGVAAVVAMLVVTVVGFGKWSISPQNPPVFLAHSIADGPGKLYLRDHCPQIELVMCRHLDRLDVSMEDFLWSDNGVFGSVSFEEQDALRKEDGSVALAAAAEHPWLQLRASTEDFFRQLSFFDLRDTRFPNSARITRTEFTSDIPQTFPDWLIALSVVDYVAVVVSSIVVVWLWFAGRLSRRSKQLVVLIVAAVLMNTFITGVVSDPSARYGARVMWLMPLLALLISPSIRPRRAARTG
jgi:hypothetical protein